MSPASRASRRPRRGHLVAVEGLDASGKSRLVEALARRLERAGQPPRIAPWEPSALVTQAVANPRERHALTPRVAALLGAADAVRRVDRVVRPRLDRGGLVLADRYAWTAVAREIARGLPQAWTADLYRPFPVPDLVLLVHPDPVASAAAALAGRTGTMLPAVESAYAAFLGRVAAAYAELAAGAAAPGARPWPVLVAEIDSGTTGEMLGAAWPLVRAAVRADAA